MSDSNLNQNTSEDRDARANGPEAAPAAAAAAPRDQAEDLHAPHGADRLAGCGVAGLAVGGVLASWGVEVDRLGRIEIRTTPTKMIVTDRARCSGCQRCEMMCALKNDGRVSQHRPRARVAELQLGREPRRPDSVYRTASSRWSTAKNGAPRPRAGVLPGPRHLRQRGQRRPHGGRRPLHRLRHVRPRLPVEHAARRLRAACPPSASAAAAPSSARTAPSSSSTGRTSRRRSSSRAS